MPKNKSSSGKNFIRKIRSKKSRKKRQLRKKRQQRGGKIVMAQRYFNEGYPNHYYSQEQLQQMGNVNIGLDDINKYCIIKAETMECPICSQPCKLIRETKCQHKFCLSCIEEWAKESKNCPICMKELQIIN